MSKSRLRSIGHWLLSFLKTKEVMTIRTYRGLGWNSPDFTGNEFTYPVYSFLGVRFIAAVAARDANQSVIKCNEWFERLHLRGNGYRTRCVLATVRKREFCPGCDGGCQDCLSDQVEQESKQ